MSWLGLSLGELGSQAGQAKDIAMGWREREQNMRIAAAKQKLEESLMPLRIAEIQDIQNRIKRSMQPQMRSSFTTPDGSIYAVMQNPSTGEVTTQALYHGMQKYPEFKNLQEMQAWGLTHGDADLVKQAQEAIKATQRQPSIPATTQEYEDYKRGLGGTLTPAQVLNFRRQPRAEAESAGPEDVDTYAQDLSERRITLAQVPVKIRSAVLKHMRSNKMNLPPQLPGGTLDKLSQREAALDNTISILKDVQQDMDLLEKLPTASLVQLAQSSDRVPAALTRFMGMFQSDEEKMRISRLAGNLRSLQEHINVLRSPLGATGFRGQEGWSALQSQSVRALTAPGVNKQVMKNTLSVLEKLRDKTEQILTGEEPEKTDTTETPQGTTANAPPPGAKVRDYTSLGPG